ncbi:MAG: hypothetical protein LBU28_11405 [Spirochaetaceae bacterium]|jgi:uncharacterized protein (TIGR03545 family)|nr:hypothetical protein [Spirochaetaceae bacterium]
MDQSKDKKAPASPAIPRSLRDGLSPKVFERRFLAALEHPVDREFFASHFEIRDDRYVLREGLGQADMKRIKLLLRAIRANRKGPVKFLPLIVMALVIAALAVFFTVFMNPLLERALERGMEALFEARVNVDRFNLELLRFRVGIGGITVANRDRPMKNLFQTGRMEFRLKPAAVLRGKIYIEEIRTDAIRFGTDRIVSGALPDRPPKAKPPKPSAPEAPPLVDLRNFDALGLLNREYDKLATPRAYNAAIAAYNASLEKWKDQVELLQSRGNALRAAAQPLLTLPPPNAAALNVETIAKTVADITSLAALVQTAADEAGHILDALEEDIETARSLEALARGSITGDLDHLKSYLDLGSGAAFSALEPSIREILSDAAEQYLDYGLRALEVFEKLSALSAALPKSAPKPKQAAFKGRDVAFPSRAYPGFYLGILASDFTLEGWNWSLDLRGVSSDPDLSGTPVRLALGLSETAETGLSRKAAFQGSADFRSAAEERFSATIFGEGFPVSLGDQLKAAGIGGFSGETAFRLGVAGRTNGGVAGSGGVEIRDPRLADPAGTLAQAVDTALREAGELLLGIDYEHFTDRDDRFSLSTNIGDLILSALKRTAELYAKKAADELERVLRERIAESIAGSFVSKDDLDILFKTLRGDTTDLGALKGSLEAKKTEFERKIRAAADEAVQQAADEAQRQAEQAVQDILQGKTPTLEAPSLPKLPLKLPGR